MVIFSKTRREQNIFAWVLSWSANLRRLCNALDSEDVVPVGISNELWRVYLATDIAENDMCASQHIDRNHPETFNGKAPAQQRRQAAVAILGRPLDKFNLQEATWRGFTVRWGTFFHHDSKLVQEIMWDLHRSSFRFDLIALDRYLAPDRWECHKYERLDALCTIFGASDALVFEDGQIENSGITSHNVYKRQRAYAAFASLMDSWSVTTHDVSSANARLLGDHIAFWYCSTLARNFGRPPVLPKLVPVSKPFRSIIPYPPVVSTCDRVANNRGCVDRFLPNSTVTTSTTI